MKKKQRRLIKDYYQIGNYIYADLYGRVQIVIPKNEKVTKAKITQDFETLISRYSIDAAITYLKYCSDYRNNSNR
ncbi:MAG: hypothetical protein J6O99_07030 [Methanobrevibacter sp.]|nr:hypothetical protein [Methanobrevibacter sp.]